jgi:hypothetical protein
MVIEEDELRRTLSDYVKKNDDRVGFTKFFWKGCEPLPSDLQMYSEYAYLLGSSKVPAADFVNRRRQYGFEVMSRNRPPKLGLYLRALLELGEPSPGCVWLNTECSQGYGHPIGDYVQVPTKISSWNDVEKVVDQLKSLNEDDSRFSKNYIFGFMVGIIIGDGHKPKQGRGHRHLNLTLSKRYDTNLKIGDFTTFCVNNLGLRMERKPDLPKPENKPFGFYVWTSQSSPLFDWIFNVVLGLDDGQTTTYDKVHMDWAFDAPLDFRLGLLHGIAESDGSVSVASQTVEFWIIPDWYFMLHLLASFGIHGFRNREAVSIVKSEAINSFKIPVFAPHLRTVRYSRHELMATTPKLEKKDRLPNNIRSEIMRLAEQGHSIPEIVVEIAEAKKLLVSFEAAQRWAMKTGKYQPRKSAEQADLDRDSNVDDTSTGKK